MEIALSSIHIRPDRQRKDLGDLTALKASLLNVGLINPIVVEEVDGQFYLIAGERRFTAWSQLASEGQLPGTIPCTRLDTLSPSVRHEIELEENIKRKDLTWQEYVQAIEEMFQLKNCSTNEELANYLGISESSVVRARIIWANRDNPKVFAADNLTAAYSICRRENARTIENIRADMGQFLEDMLEESKNGTESKSESKPQTGALRCGTSISQSTGDDTRSLSNVETESVAVSGSSAKDPYPTVQIIAGNFVEWAETYSGPKFNLLHLDFPYGINHQKSAQGNTKNFDNYDDSPEVYIQLVQALAKAQDRLLAESCHVICWMSLKFQAWTDKQFEAMGFTPLLQPYHWYKSDNKGIVADPTCGMRNVCEYARIYIRARRPVVKCIANLFPWPCTKKFHVSEKPLEMEHHLLSAFVDSHTRMLDPTCGSGTSIMASLEYKPEFALGIELDPEIAGKAQDWLEKEKQRVKSADLELDLSSLDI